MCKKCCDFDKIVISRDGNLATLLFFLNESKVNSCEVFFTYKKYYKKVFDFSKDIVTVETIGYDGEFKDIVTINKKRLVRFFKSINPTGCKYKVEHIMYDHN